MEYTYTDLERDDGEPDRNTRFSFGTDNNSWVGYIEIREIIGWETSVEVTPGMRRREVRAIECDMHGTPWGRNLEHGETIVNVIPAAPGSYNVYCTIDDEGVTHLVDTIIGRGDYGGRWRGDQDDRALWVATGIARQNRDIEDDKFQQDMRERYGDHRRSV